MHIEQPFKLWEAHRLLFGELLTLLEMPLLEKELLVADRLLQLSLTLFLPHCLGTDCLLLGGEVFMAQNRLTLLLDNEELIRCF